MKFVVDASVAIKWAVEEDDRAAARALVTGNHELVAPDFVLIETANILWKKVRRREIGGAQARSAIPGVRRVFSSLLPTAIFVDRAIEMALELDHPVYDCLYLATGEEESAKVVTADRRLLQVLSGSPFANRAVALGDVLS